MTLPNIICQSYKLSEHAVQFIIINLLRDDIYILASSLQSDICGFNSFLIVNATL